jgi:CheY-like chemotaxis protein
MTIPEEITESALPETINVARHGKPRDRRARVLLVEDDNALRRYLEVTLQRADYKVILAADGLEAMKLVLTTPVDIVITDAMMPNLNGHEFCRFLKNNPQFSDIPVVLLSALERKTGSREETQADAFLSKPVSAEVLINCLAGLLRVNGKS